MDEASFVLAITSLVPAKQKAPSGWARRVKKICLWHIFSQSGKQAMLATWAEGWRRRRLKESACRFVT